MTELWHLREAIFRVLSVTEGEAIAAAIWYEDQQPGMADKFLVQMHPAYESIVRNPAGPQPNTVKDFP